MARAVIFDVDGTLVDSNDLHVEAWREAFSHYGKTFTHDEIHSQIGKGGDQLMPVFLSPDELERYGEELEALRVRVFTEQCLPRVKPFPRVRELFERLRADGLRIALASSAKKPELEAHMRMLGVESLVDATTCADDVDRSKPFPDVFVAALTALGKVKPEEALVVGDAPYDAIAARRAGMGTIGLLSGGFAAESLRANGVIAVYRDVADLLARYEDSPLALAPTARV